MSAPQALSLCLSIAFATLALAQVSIWRTLRQGCWAVFAFTAALASVYFLLQHRMPPVNNQPHFGATVLAFAMMSMGWLSVGAYLGVRTRALRVLGAIYPA